MNRVRSLLRGRRFATMRFSSTSRALDKGFHKMISAPTTSLRVGSRPFSLSQKSWFVGKNMSRLYPVNRFNNHSTFCSVPIENVSPKDEGSMLEKLTVALTEDDRKQLSRNDFAELSLRFGCDTNSIDNLRDDLVQSGVIMDLGEEFQTIVINPEQVKKAWNHALDLDRSYTIDFISKRKVELEALRLKIEPLEMQLEKIEQKSERSAIWMMRGLFGYTILHTWLIAYLTFWLLSWDIMEPITYLVNLYGFVIAVYFFNSTSCEFTFDAIKETLKAIKRRKLFAGQKFDEEEYDKLKREIYLAEQDLYNPEWFVLNEVAQEAAGTTMQNPAKCSEEM